MSKAIQSSPTGRHRKAGGAGRPLSTSHQDYRVCARHGTELLFELRSKDPRDLVQVIWTRVKGINDLELTVEEVHGVHRTTKEVVRLKRSPQLFDKLTAIAAGWQKLRSIEPKNPESRNPG